MPTLGGNFTTMRKSIAVAFATALALSAGAVAYAQAGDEPKTYPDVQTCVEGNPGGYVCPPGVPVPEDPAPASATPADTQVAPTTTIPSIESVVEALAPIQYNPETGVLGAIQPDPAAGDGILSSGGA